MRGTWLALVLLVGCPPSQPEPIRYVVVRGDTLGQIAKVHGVSVDELRTWNGIEGDLIEVDQVLLIRVDVAAETPSVSTPRRRASRPRARATPDLSNALVKPTPKACLPPPTEVEGSEDGMAAVASRGLDPSQIRTAFDAFVPKTTSCLPDDFRGEARVQLDLVIGCDGIVRDAQVFSGGGLPQPVLACITERMQYAAFPAHDLPDGERARVPLAFAYTPPAESP